MTHSSFCTVVNLLAWAGGGRLCWLLGQAMEEALGMTRVVCEELLARGKKTFLRRKLEEGGTRALDDPALSRRLRHCAANLGVSLR